MPFSVPVFEVQTVHKKMGSGRNGVFLVECIDQSQNGAGTYILKPLSKLADSGGLQNELMAGLLAKRLGLPMADFAILNVQADLAEALKNTNYDEISKSVGQNFGTKFLTGGFHTWPNLGPFSKDLENLCGEILAFDAFVQNADRRNDNPNLLQNGSEVVLIDHDMAFSFTLLLGLIPKPWEEEAFKACIVQKGHSHVFYSQLRAQGLQLDSFLARLNLITDGEFDEMMECVPATWKTGKSPAILTHLKELRSQSDQFILNLRRVMS